MHEPECTSPQCACSINRRELLKVASAAAAAALVAHVPAMAGPFQAADFEKLVPADKKLKPEWVKSLFDRGTPAVYRGDELKYIGMPIGGLCSGQLYLGGDGKLWHWDIFNQHIGTGDGHYAKPPLPASPLQQGFAIRIKSGDRTETYTLDRVGFRDVTFRGEYPIGTIDYIDRTTPVRIRLEAFSPFIPLNVPDSAIPATIMRFTVRNSGLDPVECQLAGWLENAVCLHSGQPVGVTTVRKPAANVTVVEHSATDLPPDQKKALRPDIVFDDFEKETYEGWTVTGTAFGKGPIERSRIPAYQGDVGGVGKRVVNSHATAPGNNVADKDNATGTLTSKSFTIERDHITFFIGGGAHKDRTCMNLLVDGKVVASATGANDNKMKPSSFDVRKWAGKSAQLQIVDNVAGPWGNIGIDHIVFSDVSARSQVPLGDRPDFGTMAIGIIGPQDGVEAIPTFDDAGLPDAAFKPDPTGGGPVKGHACGSILRRFALDSGQEQTIAFAISWHFPNLNLQGVPRGRYYATRHKSASDVAEYLAHHFEALVAQTKLWRDTWYDSTLPYWFLDRTFANTLILATSTSYWLGNGRFYGWEGVGCCAGTCAHVWHYAHAPARLFPQLERAAREMGDYTAGFDANTGQIGFRAEHGRHWAVDAQSGCILRAYREHQMSADDSFLKRLWPKVKKSLEFLIARDGNGDGIINGPQHNTLDADWFGEIAWLSGLYLAALRGRRDGSGDGRRCVRRSVPRDLREGPEEH